MPNCWPRRYGGSGLPSSPAYVISFSFIGVMWINHHRLFTHIRKADNGLLILNALLLLSITFVPYPTAVLASFLGTPDARAALIFYNGVYVFVAIFFNALWNYSVARNLVDSKTQEGARSITRQYLGGPLLYLVCLALAWVSVGASLAMNLALAVFFAIPPENFRKRTT